MKRLPAPVWRTVTEAEVKAIQLLWAMKELDSRHALVAKWLLGHPNYINWMVLPFGKAGELPEFAWHPETPEDVRQRGQRSIEYWMKRWHDERSDS